jgi:hypothetical protein
LVFAVVLMLGGLAGFWVSLARGTKHGRQTAKLLGCNYCFVVEQRWAAELLRAACNLGLHIRTLCVILTMRDYQSGEDM